MERRESCSSSSGTSAWQWTLSQPKAVGSSPTPQSNKQGIILHPTWEICTKNINIHVEASTAVISLPEVAVSFCSWFFTPVICTYIYVYMYVCIYIYRVSQEECARLREGVPCVKVYRYNPKHLCPKLNGYGDNGQRSLKLWQLLHTCWLPNTY